MLLNFRMEHVEQISVRSLSLIVVLVVVATGADLRIADAASGRHHPAGRHRSDRPAAAHEVSA